MLKFRVAGPEEESPIEFKLEVDDMGDIELIATKGQYESAVLTIHSLDGTMGRIGNVDPDIGLSLDYKGRIEICEDE